MVSIKKFPSPEELYQAACQHILQAGQQAVARQGHFSLVLAGGSTPEGAYRLLAAQVPALEWRNVHFFWGDERCVAPDHPDSNYRLAQQALLAHLPVPDANIHRIEGELSPSRAASRYEEHIREFFGRLGYQEGNPQQLPSFDLVLLGIGEDGHTASLFPGSPALAESQRWVVEVDHNQPPPPLVTRVTLTLPLINAARDVVLLVTGKGKAARLEQVFQGESDPPLPAQLVRPLSGNLTWMVDQAAGVRISSQGARFPAP